MQSKKHHVINGWTMYIIMGRNDHDLIWLTPVSITSEFALSLLSIYLCDWFNVANSRAKKASTSCHGNRCLKEEEEEERKSCTKKTAVINYGAREKEKINIHSSSDSFKS